MSKEKVVLIMGAGTVGNRGADVLLSLGVPVALCKYDADPSDIKTQELKQIFNSHRDTDVGKRLRLYAARGSNADTRAKNLEREIGTCSGSIDDLDFSTVELAVDATNGMEVRNHIEIYLPHNLPFAINGGGDTRLVKGLYFASVPNSTTSENWAEASKANAKIVSCNTHCITTALGIISGVINDPAEFTGRIRDIGITFNRRHEDPHKGAHRPQFVTVAPKPYHIDEIEYLTPAAEGMIETIVSKWPTEYFHNVTLQIDFKDELSPDFIEEVRYAFQTYPRCIFVEDELSHHKTINAASWARIGDGDLPFPVFMIHQMGKYKLQIFALTPQRGIVAPSTADYVLARTGRLPGATSWKQVFDYTNSHARYRQETFSHIKNAIQDNLKKYDRTATVIKEASEAQ